MFRSRLFTIDLFVTEEAETVLLFILSALCLNLRAEPVHPMTFSGSVNCFLRYSNRDSPPRTILHKPTGICTFLRCFDCEGDYVLSSPPPSPLRLFKHGRYSVFLLWPLHRLLSFSSFTQMRAR